MNKTMFNQKAGLLKKRIYIISCILILICIDIQFVYSETVEEFVERIQREEQKSKIKIDNSKNNQPRVQNIKSQRSSHAVIAICSVFNFSDNKQNENISYLIRQNISKWLLLSGSNVTTVNYPPDPEQMTLVSYQKQLHNLMKTVSQGSIDYVVTGYFFIKNNQITIYLHLFIKPQNRIIEFVVNKENYTKEFNQATFELAMYIESAIYSAKYEKNRDVPKDIVINRYNTNNVEKVQHNNMNKVTWKPRKEDPQSEIYTFIGLGMMYGYADPFNWDNGAFNRESVRMLSLYAYWNFLNLDNSILSQYGILKKMAVLGSADFTQGTLRSRYIPQVSTTRTSKFNSMGFLVGPLLTFLDNGFLSFDVSAGLGFVYSQISVDVEKQSIGLNYFVLPEEIESNYNFYFGSMIKLNLNFHPAMYCTASISYRQIQYSEEAMGMMSVQAGIGLRF